MGKRALLEDADRDQVPARKKAKPSKISKTGKEVLTISSWKDLRRILTFQQDEISNLRQSRS